MDTEAKGWKSVAKPVCRRFWTWDPVSCNKREIVYQKTVLNKSGGVCPYPQWWGGYGKWRRCTATSSWDLLHGKGNVEYFLEGLYVPQTSEASWSFCQTVYGLWVLDGSEYHGQIHKFCAELLWRKKKNSCFWEFLEKAGGIWKEEQFRQNGILIPWKNVWIYGRNWILHQFGS